MNIPKNILGNVSRIDTLMVAGGSMFGSVYGGITGCSLNVKPKEKVSSSLLFAVSVTKPRRILSSELGMVGKCQSSHAAQNVTFWLKKLGKRVPGLAILFGRLPSGCL